MNIEEIGPDWIGEQVFLINNKILNACLLSPHIEDIHEAILGFLPFTH
jgi:hypothetical protein